MKQLLAATTFLCLAACSPEPASETPDTAAKTAPEPGTVAPTATTPTPTPSMPPPATLVPADPHTLTLQGLGTLRVGRPVPTAGSWAERGQVSDGCRTITSPDVPGVYAIVEEREVRRITVGQRSDVKLAEGIGVGAPEAEVRAAFPGFRAEPHKYVDAPAKYLTAPNAEGGDPALRFEIGADGKVSLIHIGTAPVLFYVEGCA